MTEPRDSLEPICGNCKYIIFRDPTACKLTDEEIDYCDTCDKWRKQDE